MKTINFFIKISRPRFWLYLAGPFAIGFLVAVNKFSDLNNIKIEFYCLFLIVGFANIAKGLMYIFF
jgi:4-hydroxybenzoate polyprenyltransferase